MDDIVNLIKRQEQQKIMAPYVIEREAAGRVKARMKVDLKPRWD